MHKDPHETLPSEEKKPAGFFLWVERILAGLVLLTALTLLILHLPPVQRWGIEKIKASMSKTLNTKVELAGFSLHPVSDLTLKGLFIGSPEHAFDTLLYAEELSVDYRRLWDIFNRRFTINQVGVANGVLNIHRIAGDSLTNLDVMLARILPPRNPNKPDFVLDLKTLHATQLTVRVDDEVSGSLMNLYFKRADIRADQLDITRRFVDIADLDLDDPEIRIVNRLPMIDSTRPPVTNSVIWNLDVDHMQITNGQLMIDNKLKAQQFYPNQRGIDYAHLDLERFDIRMDSLRIRGWDFRAKDVDMALKHRNGFEINTLAADHAIVSDTGVIIKALTIVSPKSEIRNDFSMLYTGYRDFSSFVDSVRFSIPNTNIRLNVDDLLSIAPGLQQVGFFTENAKQDILLQGQVTGHVNRLRIKKMTAGLGDIFLNGDFRSRDIVVKGKQNISLDLQRSSISAAALQSLFPKLRLPPVLTKLGQISFAGDIEGYPDDFVAFGTFNTALGNVTLDMNMNIVQGLDKGNYSGSIALQDFDLGRFTGNPDLGKITMSGRVIEGIGLTSSNMYADITAQLTALGYNGYIYHNARVDGQLTGKLFEGVVDINDPNVDMQFEGTVDFRDSLARLNFISRIDSIHFWPLGLSKKDLSLKGILDVNLLLGQFSEIEGHLIGEKMVLRVDSVDYPLDSLQFNAVADSMSAGRTYTLDSDILRANISGLVDPATLAGQVQMYLHEVYPREIDLPAKLPTRNPKQQFSWDIQVKDSKRWFDLTGLTSLRLENTILRGNMDLPNRKVNGTIFLPELHYQKINAYAATVRFSEENGRSNLDLKMTAADMDESVFFEEVWIKGEATNDSVNINLKTDQLANIVNKLDIDIDLLPEGDNWAISLLPINLKMFGGTWSIPKGNKVEIRKNWFSLDQFELVSSDQKIMLDDIDHKGLVAYIDGFDISYLNEIWINDKFDFFGRYTLDAEIDNIYDMRQMEAVLSLPELKINNVPYGQLVLNAAMTDPKDSVRINLALRNGETTLSGKGAYLPQLKSIAPGQGNFLRIDLEATEFPLDFLEFLMGGNIRDTEGSVDMTLQLKGKANALDTRGKGTVYNGSTVIDYLGAAYSFHDQKFTISETMIDLSGTKIYDVLGNTAIVQGGITHRYFRNLGLAATLRSDKILGLDVTSEENNIFYGKGIGAVFAEFSGSVANPKMVINTTTAKGTHIYIPMSGSSTDTEKDFAVFLQNGMLPVVPPTLINISGIDLTMNMTITDDAIVEIIFDENTGEVLRGQGTGDLTLSMNRLGNFSMYGNFTIARGDYLFTNFRIVRKPFELLPGGNIQWGGDPYDAQLNVQAKYKDLSASVYTLIQEYITDPGGAQQDVYDQARQRTPVDLTMKLTGSLMHPNIAFDIAFPELSGELKGYTTSKVNTLKANENAMLQQVVGLLITRSFLPTTSGTASSVLLTEGIDNTFSELIAATLSGYLGGLLGDLIPTGTVLSGITLQMSLDLPITQANINDQTNPLDDPNATVVEVDLPLEFFNDRLEVKVGTDYVTGATTVSESEYWAGDVTFLYKLTPDGRLKIRAYNQNTLTVEGRKNKVGVGLSYRREYDSLGEMFGKKK
jgi:hypothetical protein